MILQHALKHAPADSQGMKRAFGMKPESKNYWRAVAYWLEPNGMTWIEIQIRSITDSVWMPMLRVLEKELSFIDPEIQWWPS